MSTWQSEELAFQGLSWMKDMEQHQYFDQAASHADKNVISAEQHRAYLDALPKLDDSRWDNRYKTMSDAPKEIQDEYNTYLDMEV